MTSAQVVGAPLPGSVGKDEFVTHQPPRRRLPLQPGPLIGRDALLAEASALLRRDGVRLLTLTGPAGAGKTRLALAVAEAVLREYPDEYPDGVVFVDLAPLRDPTRVVAAVAGAAGVGDIGDSGDSGGRPLTAAVTAALGSQRLLLLLDNFEQVLAAAPAIAALLAACPGVAVLATSRAALHLRWEHELAVPPLTVPDLARPLPGPAELAELAATPAVALFAARARAIRQDFVLTAENAPAVAEICVRLDGLPLALELAAARTRALAPAALLARLARRLHFLTGGGLDRPTRHQTLRAAIGSSYDLLAPAERALFRRLAVFAGGASLEAAVAVCAGPDLPEAELLDHLDALAAGSLLRVEAPAGRGPARYAMLQSVRAYAAERLAECGEAEAHLRRHAWYRLRQAERAAGELRGPGQGAALARLDAAHDDLRAVLARSLPPDAASPVGLPDEPPAGRAGLADPVLGLRLAGALAPYWLVRGHLTDGQRWLDRLLDAAGPAAPPEARARALLGAGLLARARPDWARARARLEEGLAVARGLGRPRLAGQLAAALGGLLHDLGEMAAGGPLLEEGVARLGAAGDPAARADAGLARAVLAEARHDRPAARAALEEALAVARQTGDRVAQAAALHDLGRLAAAGGEAERARALLEEGLAAAGALGSPGERLRCHRGLGELLGRAGDLAAAEGHLRASLDLAREIDSAAAVAYGLTALGAAALRGGDAARATALLEEGLARAEASGHPRARGEALGGLAAAAAAAGDRARALALLHQRLLFSRDLDDRAALAGALEQLADLLETENTSGPPESLRRGAAALRRTPGAAGAVGPAGAPVVLAPASAGVCGAERTIAEALALTAPDAAGRGHGAGPAPRPFDLTEREAEVLGHLARGASDAEIARRLVISVRTANRHVSNILSKTAAPNRTAAAALALGRGLARG